MPLNWRKLAREKSAGGFRRPLHFMNLKEMREWGVLLGAVKKTVDICLLSILKAPSSHPEGRSPKNESA